MEEHQQDICRVCRSEATQDKPLFYPCVCTGSIKFIHQECLVQWLKYSKKEYCELCKHRFAFTPIYSPDMPKRLPVQDIFSGLLKSIARAVRYWLHYTLVAAAWLGVVPLTACRIYRCLFTGSVNSLLTLPLDMLSTENLVADCFQGCFVVTCTLCAFISLVWLREQILHGGGPEWLEADNRPRQNGVNNGGAMGQAGALIGGVLGNHGNNGEAPPPEAPAAANQNAEAENNEAEDPVNNGNNAAQDDNWNPIEWDRAAEELTWEREHVFWVVSLNTLFILVFAFCPYHIGHFTVVGMKFDSSLSETQFQGLLTTLLGYCIIAICLVFLHGLATLARFKKSQRVLGLCFVVVKVSLLVVVEIGLFPLVCGWWLDICSLNTFDATLKDRIASFRVAPGTSMFIHWLVGMVYVFYFASFILLLREVLRPGVLWFLRNLNDPEFNPIQEMIHLPMYRHVRRFLASMVIFGSTVLIMLYLPVRLIRFLLPGFLPYNVTLLSTDTPVSELSLELLLLQVVLPALLEQGHTRQWLKNLVRCWCVAVAWLLDLRSYLLGDVPVDGEEGDVPAPEVVPDQGEELNEERADLEEEPVVEDVEVAAVVDPVFNGLYDENHGDGDLLRDEGHDDEHVMLHPVNEHGEGDAEPQGEDAGAGNVGVAEEGEAGEEPAVGPAPAAGQDPPQGLGAAHQALLQPAGPVGFQPYNRPTYFLMKLHLLMVILCVTLFLSSLVSFIVPVYIGRQLMSLWMGDTKVHELYTAACGLYTCWVTLRVATMVYNWVPQGHTMVLKKAREWSVLAFKSLLIASLLIGLVPLLLGLLFELVIVAPIRVPFDQSPVFYPWQDWALGVLHAKIICAMTMMGPQWWLKRVIEQVYNQGLRNMDLVFIINQLCVPLIGCLGMCLALPYIFTRSIMPALGASQEIQIVLWRRIYPFLLGVVLLASFIVFQMRQFKRLYEHIKNDKYLVGQRLVNYDRKPRISMATTDSTVL